MKAVLTVLGALAASALFAGSYKWTGAVSSDFADAGNWLVQSGDEWVATETPPANAYGVDTVVFDGDAATCPNQPVISTDYTVRDLKFLTSGWTISGTGSLRLNHCYGGNNYTVDGVKRGNIGTALIDSSGSGTNTIAVVFKVTFGYVFDIAEGGSVKLSGSYTVDNGPGNNLGSSAKHSRKLGGGTLILGGVGSACKLVEKYLDVYDGTVLLERVNSDGKGVNVVNGPLRVVRNGRVVFGASDQVKVTGDPWMLSGSGTIDFAEWYQSITDVRIGAESAVETGVDWTGEILNSQNVRIGSGNSNAVGAGGRFNVNPVISEPVVLRSGIDTICEQESNAESTGRLKFNIGDSPLLPVEMKIDGAIIPGNTCTYMNIDGLTYDGATTYGAIEFNSGSDCSRAMLWINSTVYMNSSETPAFGSIVHLEIGKTGVLAGSGLVNFYTSSTSDTYPKYDRAEADDRTIKIYGTLAPGSIGEPSGTLTIQRSVNQKTFATRFFTNSVFRLNVAEDGILPKVVQTSGSVEIDDVASVRAALGAQNAAIEEANAALGEGETPTVLIDIDAAMEGIVAPKIVIAGANAPTRGRHRILSVTGTLNGEFAPVVELTGFPHADRYSAQVLYTTEGDTTHVDVKIGKSGLAVIIR